MGLILIFLGVPCPDPHRRNAAYGSRGEDRAVSVQDPRDRGVFILNIDHDVVRGVIEVLMTQAVLVVAEKTCFAPLSRNGREAIQAVHFKDVVKL